MANHGYVTSRKHIRKEMVDRALAKINDKFLFGEMKIEYYKPEAGDTFSTHAWNVTFENSDGKEFASRSFWIPYGKPRTFEIRHGGGGDFIWWVDLLIRNAVAAECDGMISDDGCDGKEPAETSPSLPFREHQIRHWSNIGLPLSNIRWLLNQYKNDRFGNIPKKHLARVK